MEEMPIGYVVVSKAGMLSIDYSGSISDSGNKFIYDTFGAAMHAAVQVHEQLGSASFKVYPIWTIC